MINKQKNTVLNILLYNSFMTLKPKYMLNQTSSDKTSETLFRPPVSAVISDLTFWAFVDAHLRTCIVVHGYFLSHW